MATNNVNNKVTFWNNVSFTPENVKNNFILNDIQGLDNKGIYFNSNKNYPHIIYNGYIYTTGSYISEYTYNNNVDPKGQVNVITNITADPFGKSISYQYTTIDIADILKRIDELEKQAAITDVSDTITLTNEDGTPFTTMSLLVGEQKHIKCKTQSGLLSSYTSNNSYVAYVVSKNDVDHTITITAKELIKDDDRTQTASIVLTSYTGTIDDKRYTSTEKTIDVSVNKKSQNINYGNSFDGPFTVGGAAKKLNIQNAYTDICITYGTSNSSNTDIISISYKSGDTYTYISSGAVISEKEIIVYPNNEGTGYIKVYATSSTAYKRSDDLRIPVEVMAQQVEPNSIEFTQSTLTLTGKNDKRKLTYALDPPGTNTKNAVKFRSNDTGIVTVGETTGVVTPVGTGSTTITATTENEKTATCTIIVKDGSVQSLTVNPKTKKLGYEGGTVDIKADVTYTCFANPQVTWGFSPSSTGSFTGGLSEIYTYSGEYVTFTAYQNNSIDNVEINITASYISQSATICQDMCTVILSGKPVENIYYWYVGKNNPVDISEIPESEITNEDTKMGWHLIGTELGEYSSSNMLHKGGAGTINIDLDYNNVKYYIALPIGIGIYNGLGQNITNNYTLESTSTIMGVEYNVYSDINSEFTFNLY